jgi:hypothetical protein
MPNDPYEKLKNLAVQMKMQDDIKKSMKKTVERAKEAERPKDRSEILKIIDAFLGRTPKK